MADPQRVHRGATGVLSVAMVLIGVALIGQALGNGAPLLRIVLGLLFVAAGVGRLYMLRARERRDGSG